VCISIITELYSIPVLGTCCHDSELPVHTILRGVVGYKNDDHVMIERDVGKSAKNANVDNITTNSVKNTVMTQDERQEGVP
jgi:hypothetical protein